MVLLTAIVVAIVTGAMLWAIIKYGKASAFDPIVLASLCFATLYLFDWLYIAFDSFVNDGFYLSSLYFPYVDHSIAYSGLIIAAAAVSWLLGALLAKQSLHKGRGDTWRVGQARDSLVGTQCNIALAQSKRHRQSAGYIWFIAVVWCALFGSIVLGAVAHIGKTGSALGFILNASGRMQVFEDYSVQYALLYALIFGSPFIMRALFSMRDVVSRLMGYSLGGLAIFAALITGGRAALVVGVLGWFVGGASFGHRLRVRKHYLLLIVPLSIAMAQWATTTRVTGEVYRDSLIANLFNTEQITQANNAFILVDHSKGGERAGGTLLNAILAAVPRAFLSKLDYEKKYGANTDFTELFWSDRWHIQRSQLAIGGVNEWYFNFGVMGVVSSMILLGWIYQKLYQRLWLKLSGKPWVALLHTAFLWSIFQQLRGDYFHTVNNLAVFCSVAVIFAVAGVSGRAVPAPR